MCKKGKIYFYCSELGDLTVSYRFRRGDIAVERFCDGSGYPGSAHEIEITRVVDCDYKPINITDSLIDEVEELIIMEEMEN